eukprot:gene10691-10849_t
MRDADDIDWDDVLADDDEVHGEDLANKEVQREQQRAMGTPQVESQPDAAPDSDDEEHDSQLVLQILERYKQQYAEWEQQYNAVAAASDAAGGYHDPSDGPGVYRNADGTVDWDRTGLAVPPDLELTEEESLVFAVESAQDLLEKIWEALIETGVDPESCDKMDLLRAAAGLTGRTAAAAAADTQGLGYWEPEGEYEEPVFEAMCQFLDSYGTETYALAGWDPVDLAAAAAGLSKLTKEPPGLFMHHVSTRLNLTSLQEMQSWYCGRWGEPDTR